MFTAAIPVAAVMARVSEYRLPLTLMISFSRTDLPVPEIVYGACEVRQSAWDGVTNLRSR